MSELSKIVGTLFGMLVDDGSLATALLLWLLLFGFLQSRLGVPAIPKAAILVLGLWAILLENVLRRARRARH